MRTALLVLLVLGFFGTAWAADPIQFKSDKAAEVPSYEQDVLHCQPAHVYLWTINANTAFGSELADDIPEDLGPMAIHCLVFVVAEWGGYWANPAGVNISIYNEDCPPPLEGTTIEVPWSELSTVNVWYDPGWFEAYEVTWCPETPICVAPPVSIGFQPITTWGQNPPYCGVTMCNDYDVYGCGEAYWDGTYWGVPRWTAVSGYFGVPADVAYCIIGEFGPTATEESTWGSVKTLYQ